MARKNRLADRRNGLQHVKLLAELSGHTIECACEIVEFIVAIHGDTSREIAIREAGRAFLQECDRSETATDLRQAEQNNSAQCGRDDEQERVAELLERSQRRFTGLVQDDDPWFDKKRMPERHGPGPCDILLSAKSPPDPFPHRSRHVMSAKIRKRNLLRKSRVEALSLAVFNDEIRIAREGIFHLSAPQRCLIDLGDEEPCLPSAWVHDASESEARIAIGNSLNLQQGLPFLKVGDLCRREGRRLGSEAARRRISWKR